MKSSSKYMENEQSIPLHKPLARTFGVNAALILQQIRYWLRSFEATESKLPESQRMHFRRGRWWVYNSYEKWQEDNFDFWSKDTVERQIRALESRRVLISDSFNKWRGDKTKWYTIDYDWMDHLVSLHHGRCTARPLPPSPHFAVMVTATCGDDDRKMRRPIPKNTTKNNNKQGVLVDARLALLSVPISSTQWLEMSETYDIELLVKKARWFDYAWRRGWAKGVNWLHAALQQGWETPPKGFDEAKYLTDDEQSQRWAEVADRIEAEQPEREYTVYTGQEAITRRWWETAQGELALQLPRETYDAWLRHAQVVAVDGDAAFTIGLHNIQAREWVQHRLDKVIRRTLTRIAGHDVEVKYEVKA